MKVLNILWKKWPRRIGLGPELSREGKRRLWWMDHLREHGNVSFTARHSGIRRSTPYRVSRRFDAYDLTTPEDGSKRPRHLPPSGDTSQAGRLTRVQEAVAK